jgi:hypothetical protein
MDYSTAKAIRGRSLSSMITQKIRAGGGVGSSIGRSISEKMRARGTGIKEKFDPLNIAKFLTGGSNLAPAILGRLTGRKQSDINYFSGGRKTATQIGGSGALGKMQNTPTDSLSSLFTFIRQSYEQDLRMRETERTFQEEKSNEEQRRHNEFLKALKDYTSGATAVMVKPEKGGGFLDFLGTIKKMIADAVKTAIETVQKMFEWITELKVLRTFLPKLITFLGTPLTAFGLSLLGMASIAALAGALYYLIKKDTPPGEETEATAGLSPADAAMQTGGVVPGKRYTELDVENMAKERSVFNRMEDFKTKMRNMKRFGQTEDRLDKYLDEYAQSSDPVDSEAAKRLIAERQKAKYGAKESFRRSEIQSGNLSGGGSPASMSSGGGTGGSTPVQSTPMSPVSSAPMSSPVYGSSSENADLNMMGNVGNGASAAPIITSSVNNSSTEQPMPATASIRDSTDVLSRVMNQSAAYV